ncbi:MAG: PQQ-binding-like beta-propeller repeat protein [Ignavibacteria bacterium]
MEPQHNYSTGSGMPQQVYGKKKSKAGCFIIAILIILVFGGGLTYVVYKLYYKVSDTVENFTDKFKNLKNDKLGSRNEDSRFQGAFIDAILVPVTGSTPKLFMLTDASKTYIETKKSPGHYSTGVACIDCKTMVYIYDPSADKVIKNTEYKYPDVVNATDIALNNGKVYQFTRAYSETQAGINIYDAVTGELLNETADFTSKYPELSSGISELNYKPEQRIAKFETKDGRKDIIFSVEFERMFKNEKELRSTIENSAEGESFIFAMTSEDRDSRKQLYKITAPKKTILGQGSLLMSYAGTPGMLKIHNAVSEKVSDKNYIEGILYFQDEDYVYIISQDQAGKKASRILSCIDTKTGREVWSVQQSELFSYMRIDEEANSSLSLSSSKSKISIQRLGNIVILKLKGDGVMAFDSATGKKLWSIQTEPVGLL